MNTKRPTNSDDLPAYDPADEGRSSLTDTCIRRPVLAWMLMLAVMIFGIIGYTRIGVSQLPDVDIPNVSVLVTYEGAAPEVIEQDVVQPIEESLAQVQGLKGIAATSRNGSATIQLEFDVSRDIDAAVQDVQNRLGQVQFLLPADVDPPVVTKTNFEDLPIMWISLSGPFSRQALADAARYLVKPALQTVPGVGEIQWGGYIERNVRIWLDRSKLDGFGLTASEVVAALRRQHIELPAGRMESFAREMDVRVLGEALSLDELRGLPIAGDNGRPVRLGDVALVQDGFEDERAIGRNSGRPAQALGVKKQIGTNTVTVARGARNAIDAIRASMPEGMSLEINFDGSRFIEKSVKDVQFELLLSILLTSLVCWLFLGSMQSALNIVLAIPMSVMGTIAVLYFAGFTMNTFTLLALTLAIGVVVDDAIMVQENISRHCELGMMPRLAASLGTREIRFAALSASAAVVAIFLPVIFMPGVIGKFFLQFGVALSVAVMLSYLEAVTLAPARCAQFMRQGKQVRGRLGTWIDHGFSKLAQRYRRILPVALRHPFLTLFGTLLIFIAGVALIASPLLRKEAYPPVDDGSLFVRYETQAGSSLGETDQLMRKAEQWFLAREEVARFYAIIGGFGGTGTNTGIMFVTLTPAHNRTLGKDDFRKVASEELNRIAGLRATVVMDPGPGSRGYSIEFSLRGSDWDNVVAGSQTLTQLMRDADIFTDVDTDYQLGRPEIAITPNRSRCQDLGVSVMTVAETINILIGGVRAGKFTQGTRREDIRVRLLESDRLVPSDLAHYRVRTSSGELIPLSELVSVRERPVLQQITRKDQNRAIAIFANPAPGSGQGDGIAKVKQLAKQIPGLLLVEEGSSKQFSEIIQAFGIALVLGIMFAAMILAAQFNSLLHPISIFIVLLPAVAGAAFSLALGGHSLNVFSFIGILLLMGLVKKNSIILVDYAERGRRAGLTPGWAVLRAGAVRLRPILMTSAATATAAIPIAIGLGTGSELRQPMAVAVLGGVILSTALSLVVVPATYVLIDQLRRRLSR